MTLLRTTTLALLLVVPAVVQADDATLYDLRYKFKAGEVIRSEVVHKATVETTIKGTSQTAETRTSSTKTWKVDDVTPAGVITFTHLVENVDMWHHMQGRQEMRYNSQTDAEPPAGFADAAKRVGVPLTTIKMDDRGTILERTEHLDKGNTNATQITFPLPKEAVPVGHEWTMPYEIALTGTNGGVKQVEVRQHFTLKGVSAGVATIAVETQVLTPIHDPALEAQLIQRMTSGTIKFDIDAGRVLSQRIDLDRRVIGFNGPASSMHYLSRTEEKLLPATAQTARKPK